MTVEEAKAIVADPNATAEQKAEAQKVIDAAAGEKRFSQTEVNDIVSKRLATEAKRTDKLIKDMQAQIETLKNNPNPSPAPTDPPLPPNAGDQTAEGRLKILEQKFTQMQSSLTGKLEILQKEKDDEKKKRLEMQRDAEVRDILNEIGCVELQAGLRQFLPQIEQDGEDWVYRMRTGEIITIKEGITAEMPAWLKAPRTGDRGGAGVTGARAQKAQATSDLQREKTKLDDLRKAAEKSGGGDTTAIVKYKQQQRVVRELEDKLKKAS